MKEKTYLMGPSTSGIKLSYIAYLVVDELRAAPGAMELRLARRLPNE